MNDKIKDVHHSFGLQGHVYNRFKTRVFKRIQLFHKVITSWVYFGIFSKSNFLLKK